MTWCHALCVTQPPHASSTVTHWVTVKAAGIYNFIHRHMVANKLDRGHATQDRAQSGSGCEKSRLRVLVYWKSLFTIKWYCYPAPFSQILANGRCIYTVFRKNNIQVYIQVCFLAWLLEKVTNLNENFRQNGYWNADSNSIKIIGILLKYSLLAAM